MSHLRVLVVALGLVATLGLASRRAHAAELTLRDPSTHTRPQTLDAVAVLGFFVGYSHFGVGGWYGFPVLPDGFIPEVNDALYIEAGAVVERYGTTFVCDFSWNRVSPLAGARWNVYLTDEWTIFAAAKLGFGFRFGQSYSCGVYPYAGAVSYSSPVGDVAVGAYWAFSKDWSARFELGYFGVGAGAGTNL